MKNMKIRFFDFVTYRIKVLSLKENLKHTDEKIFTFRFHKILSECLSHDEDLWRSRVRKDNTHLIHTDST